MNKNLSLLLLIVFCVAFPAFASDLPSHYPDEGFSRTGRVNAVYPKESRVVIDDVPYQVSKDVVVHSLSAQSVSVLRIRQGVHVAFRTGSGRAIEEFWLLPNNYKPVRRR